MIEWIKITPETEFPEQGQLLFVTIFGNCTVWERWLDGELYEHEYNPHDCCVARFVDKKELFTHYAIINLPS